MSEAEQSETAQQVAELTAELAEVRKKRDQLDAQNLRVTNNLRRTIAERDAGSEQLARCKEEVDTLAAKNALLQGTIMDLRAAKSVIVAERDVAERERTESRAEVVRLVRLRGERDAALAERDAARKASSELREQLAEVREKNGRLQAMNNQLAQTIEDMCLEQRDVSQLQVERDSTREQLARCKEEVDTLAAENTSLRDTMESLRHKQIHPDLPGLLAAIQAATGQARELI
jgi:chromosome segregation ATPase